MKEKIALITGVTGQDGSYLAEYLLNLGYEVHGLKGALLASTLLGSIICMKICIAIIKGVFSYTMGI